MDKAKSFDFNAGFVYAKLDKELFRHATRPATDSSESFVLSVLNVRVPKVWFNLPCDKNVKVTLTTEQIKTLRGTIERAAETHYPKFNTNVSIYPVEQYLAFSIKITKKEPPVKELTVKEIEERLGYKIKVIAEEE